MRASAVLPAPFVPDGPPSRREPAGTDILPTVASKAWPMKLLAVLVGALSLSAACAGLWLAVRTLRFALGPDYALFHGMGPGDGDGLGIFVPALMLLALGWFLGKFARNLWKA